jgi:hypothetical protein
VDQAPCKALSVSLSLSVSASNHSIPMKRVHANFIDKETEAQRS